MTRIVFGIMSAFQRPETVAQLVSSLGGRSVVVHHDFNQRPTFALPDSLVQFIPNPALTGWGTWGYCEAIVRTLEYCLEQVDFDYFQLLSPTCLPLRPVEEFEAYLDSGDLDGHIDRIDLNSDPDVMMTFGWRFLAPRDSLRLTAMRRARSWYFADGADSRHRSGLSLLVRSRPPGATDLVANASLQATRLALNGWFGGAPFSDSFRPFVGSCWFGANRALCQHIVDAARKPSLKRFFEGLPNVDEAFFPSVIGNSGFRLGPSNHLVNFFNETGNPHWFRPGDLDRIVKSGAYFGRKFPDDPRAQIRIETLEALRLAPAAGSAAPVAAPARALPARRTPRLAFGVMSAVAEPQAVAQLAASLAPYPVVLHQDYSQQPDFVIDQANVRLVPDPAQTVSGSWSESDGLLRLLRHCLDQVEFDYLQLLSPLSLPIRPLTDLAAHVASSGVDAHANLVDISCGDPMMSYGSRTFGPQGSWRRAMLERARRWHFGPNARLVDQAGCEIWARSTSDGGALPGLRSRAGYLVTRLAQMPMLGPALPDPHARLYGGSPWFGATREVCEHIVKRAADPEWLNYFRRFDIGSDIAFATLLGNSGFRLGDSNVCSSPFEGRYRRWIQADDLPALLASDKFFAHRFSDNPASGARLSVLERVAPGRVSAPATTVLPV